MLIYSRQHSHITKLTGQLYLSLIINQVMEVVLVQYWTIILIHIGILNGNRICHFLTGLLLIWSLPRKLLILIFIGAKEIQMQKLFNYLQVMIVTRLHRIGLCLAKE